MADRQHLPTLRAVSRNAAVPHAWDSELTAAQKAGLIQFHAWPLGHWSLTEAGRDYLAEAVEDAHG